MLTVKLIKPWANNPVGTLCRMEDATAESLIAVGTAEAVVKPRKPKPVHVAQPMSRIFDEKSTTDKDNG